MPPTEETVASLRKAVRAKTRAEAAADKARTELADAIADALREGMKPTDVVKATGYTREHVRRIAREHGVEPIRTIRVPKRSDDA